MTDLPPDVPVEAVEIAPNRRYLLRDGGREDCVYLTGVREDRAHGVYCDTGRQVSIADPGALATEGRLLPVEVAVEE